MRKGQIGSQAHQGPDRGAYMPTPAEIAAACEEIQATWTQAERAKRARGQGVKALARRFLDQAEPYTVPRVTIPALRDVYHQDCDGVF